MQHSVSKAYPYSAGGDYYQALDDWLIDISLLFPLQKINKWYDFFPKNWIWDLEKKWILKVIQMQSPVLGEKNTVLTLSNMTSLSTYLVCPNISTGPF